MNPILLIRFGREMVIGVLIIALTLAVTSCRANRQEITHIKTEHALTLMTEKAAYESKRNQMELESHDKTIQAVNAATARAKADAITAADAAATNERLSQTIDRLAANAATDARYRVEYAATTGELLKECSGSITKLAKAADGHVNDIRLLQDARR